MIDVRLIEVPEGRRVQLAVIDETTRESIADLLTGEECLELGKKLQQLGAHARLPLPIDAEDGGRRGD